MAEVDELSRRARRAESEGELGEALRLYRESLEADPDQEIALRAARLLDREGRTDEALDVLRETWEARTGLRLPAGEIERAARRLSPDVDLGSWTAEWPPARDDEEPAASAARTVGAGGGRPGDEEGDGSDGGDGGEDGPAPSRRFVRRYDRRPGGNGDDAGGPAAADGAGDLRRGLEVLEELLELSPRDRRLRRRKVRYARRLGDSGLLESALVELGDLLDEEGAHRGARLLYEAAGSPDAASGPTRGPAGDEDVDEGFRRRLSEALEQAPRELERLQAAGMEALGAEGAGAVPWRAHRELGRFLLLRGRPEEAARHLAAARERSPDEGEDAADVLYELGVAHRRAGRPREARECFRRLADRDPGFAVAWEALST